MRRALAFVSVGCGLLAASCSLFVDLSNLTGGDGDASLSAGSLADASRVDGALTDAATGGDAGPCANTTGGSMRPVTLSNGTVFCIDATEVTASSYAAFLSAKAGSTDGQIPVCASLNHSFLPTTNGCPVFDPEKNGPNLPVVCVDWCDAFAFCAWAGKELCDDVSGSYENFNSGPAGTNDRWTLACTHDEDGLHAFSYGPSFDPAACNGAERDAGLLDAGSLSTCAGGYPGIFDMVGNASEWIDQCFTGSSITADHDSGTNSDGCRLQGGSFKGADNSCSTFFSYQPRGSAGSDIGFRCCGEAN